MINRRELEGLIEIGIAEMRTAEGKLLGDYGSLSGTDGKDRRAFLLSLQDLRQRASQLEALMEALPATSSFEPLAA